MRIDGTHVPPLSDNVEKENKPLARLGHASAHPDDAVVVSNRAQELIVTARTRTEKIEKLKAEIQSGKYAVDLDKLAEKIIEDELTRAGKA